MNPDPALSSNFDDGDRNRGLVGGSLAVDQSKRRTYYVRNMYLLVDRQIFGGGKASERVELAGWRDGFRREGAAEDH